MEKKKTIPASLQYDHLDIILILSGYSFTPSS